LYFSGDGKTLVSSAADGTVRFWTIPEFKEPFPVIVSSARDDKSILFCARKGDAPFIGLFPDEKTLVVGDQLGRPDKLALIRGQTCLRKWDVTKREEVPLASGALPTVVDSEIDAMSPDGRFLICIPRDIRDPFNQLPIKLFEYSSGNLIGNIIGSEVAIGWSFSPDGKKLAAAPTITDELRIWDLETKKVIAAFGIGPSRFSATRPRSDQMLAFSPNGALIAATCGKVVVWNSTTGQRAFDHDLESDGNAESVCFSPNGFTVAAGGNGIRLWNAKDGRLLAEGRTRDSRNRRAVNAMEFSPRGLYVAAAYRGRDFAIELWTIPTVGQQP
jgi:WD40 repeat protein